MKKVKLNSTSIMRKRIGLLTKRQFICAMIAIIVAAGAIFVGCRRGNFETDVSLNVERTTKPRPTDGSTPASHTINDNFYFAMDALLNCKSFIGESHGTSTAAGVEQQVKAYRVVDGDKVYKKSLAYSNFKKVGVEMYVSGDNYVLRETSKLNSVDSVSWPASPYKITEDGFLGKFGAKPNTITSYALNDKSILPSSEYLGEENGVYKFRYDLDPVEATPSIRKEMRTMAGTKTLPNFQSASLTVSIDKDWNVLQTETNSVYEVDMLGGVTAHEHIIETFRYGEEPKIPDEEVFTPYLSAEATDPAPEAATAMDYLTNGFTDYLGGQRALSVTTGEGSDLGLSGRVAINVNLSADNILDELEVRAQIDSLSYGDAELKDLFVGFNGRNGGEVYITAGALRAKLGINDVTALVGKIQAALAPSGNAEEGGGESESLLGGLDFGSILDGAEPIPQDGVTLVPLTLSLAGMDIDVKMYFTEGETISLDHIDATVKSEKFNAALKVAPAPENETVNPIPADCLDIMPAINDLLGDDLAPTLAIKVGDINATVRADLASGAVDAALGGLKVKYVDKTAYLEYGGFKGKLAATDITEITDKLLPIVQSIGGKLDNDKLTSIINSLSGMLDGGVDLGSLLPLIGYNGASDLGSIITALVNGLDTTRADGTLGISLTFGKITATLSLTEGNGAYAFGGAEVKLGDTVIDITAADKTAIEAIDNASLNDFHDILPILDIIDENGKIKLEIAVGETTINAAVNLADLTADVEAGDLLARYADGKIYLSYKGLNAYIATDGFSTVMERLTPILSSLAPDIADTLGGLGDLNIAGMLGGALETIKVTDDENGTTTLSLSIEVPALGKFDIAVSLPVVDGGYTLGDITVSGTVADKPLTITAAPSAQGVTTISQENLDKAANILPILNIIGEDNKIKLDVEIGKTVIRAAVNLADLTADVEAGDLLARYADGKIYLSYKGLNAYIATSDFSKVMDDLTPIIKAFAPKDITDALGSLGDLDIAGMLGDTLKTIKVTDKNGTTVLSLSINVPSLGAFDIAVSLPVVDGGYTLGDITVSGTVAGKDLSITATPSAQEVTTISQENLDKAADITGLLALIDGGNINLTAKIGGTDIGLTLDLNTMMLYAKIADLTAKVDLDKKTALATYSGIGVKLNLSDITSILEALEPTIKKLMKDSGTTLDVTAKLGDLANKLDIAAILGQIEFAEDGDNTISSNLEIDGGITVTLTLSTAGKKLTFVGATVTLGGTLDETKGGTEITVTPSQTAVTFDGLADETAYIDLKTVADVFAAPLNALVTAHTVTIKPHGTITLSDRTYEITDSDTVKSEIVIGHVDEVENLMLSVNIFAKATYADGSTSDHEIKFIYKRNDGGKKSGYLYYDDSASKDAHFEAQFTLDNLNATLENLKTIYNHIPELQTALSKYIPVSEPDENGNVEFKLPEIDVKKLIRSLTLEGEKLTAGLNLSALLAALPDETVKVAITAENGTTEGETAAADTEKQLSLSIGKLSLGNIAISNLTAYASGTTDPKADAFTYTAGKNVNDFSSINELTKALAVTTKYRHFNLSGNIDLNLLGKKYNGAISLEKLQIDVNKETGKTYFYAHIKRAEVKALGFVNAWSDLCGDLELYFDGREQMIYAVEHSAYDKHKVTEQDPGFDKSKATDKEEYIEKHDSPWAWDWERLEREYYYEYDYRAPEYKKYTLSYFTNNILEVLSDLLNFSSIITDNLGKTSDAKGGRLHLDQLIQEYTHEYDPNTEMDETEGIRNAAGTFVIKLNLGSLTNDVITDLPITIKHDEKFELTSIGVDLTIKFLKLNALTVSLDIKHNKTKNAAEEMRYDLEQHSQSAVEQQAQKSEYVLVG